MSVRFLPKKQSGSTKQSAGIVVFLKKPALQFLYFRIMINAKKIEELLKRPLPGANSHIKMLPLGRKLNAETEEIKKAKHSGVMLLLFIQNNELHALLIKRPSHMKHHAGQVALPGGRIEPGETVIDTALRETWEEVGIEASSIQILGSLSDLYVQVSRFLIHPFVGWIDSVENLKINKNEVDKLIFFPINRMSYEIEYALIETVTGSVNVPCFKFADDIIWGATSMILMEFFDLLKTLND